MNKIKLHSLQNFSIKNTFIFISLLSFFVAFSTFSKADSSNVKVSVTSIVEHPALDAVRDGIKDELAEQGFKEGENLEWAFETAQGNNTMAAQIARKFVGDSPNVIVPISTPSSQAVAGITKDIPIVFAAVTDPIAAGLINNVKQPGGNITGVSDASPLDKHLDLIHDIIPSAKKIGVIYNPGEANSVAIIKELQKVAEEKGYTIVESPASRSSDVQGAARNLINKVDVMYIPTDNTVVSAFESVVRIGQDSQIPVFAGDTSSVSRGAIAAVSFNYYDVGRQTGKLVARVLKGEKPGKISVETVQKTEFHVNPKAAKKMGIEIKEDVVKAANKVVE